MSYKNEELEENNSFRFKQIFKILKPREPVNAFTHLLGAAVSVPALALLIKNIPDKSIIRYYAGLYTFGISLFLLYITSGFYHLISASNKIIAVMRRMDHVMIYILIAGTYTPLCLLALTGAWRWGLLSTVWILALAGIVFKIFWFKAPRWVSTGSYIIMGWIAVSALYPLAMSISLFSMFCLVLGGLLYTMGAVVYAIQKPRINLKHFGFHEIFHMFVLAGSTTHYLMVYQLL